MKKNHYRFLVKAEDIKDNLFESKDRAIVNQIKNVFRLGIGSQISIFDGLGNEYEVEISSLDRQAVKVKILSKKKKLNSRAKIGLFCSLLKGDHFEIVLEKCTELGVSSFQPVIFDRSIVRELKSGKLERYKKIIKEASEQSGRMDLPEIFEPIIFGEALKKIKNSLNFTSVAGANKNILNIKVNHKDINIFVGPEGDFSEVELVAMKKEGFIFFNLGNGILRSETAAIISCGITAQFML